MGAKMVGPVNSVTPVGGAAQTAGQHAGNMNGGTGSALRNGARTPAAAAAEPARPVAQVAGSERAEMQPAPDMAAADMATAVRAEAPAMVTSARARAEAAQRADPAAALAAGLIALIDPVP